MTLDISEHIQRMIYLGAYERWETRTVRRHLRPGMTVIDVGANVGYFTLLAARQVGSWGRVIAVEPSAPAADRLATTVRENGLGQVHLLRCGLGRASGRGVLSEPSLQNHTPSMVGSHGRSGVIVSLRTLDEVADSYSVGQVDLLKVDVEGYEPEVFAGASRLLAERRIRAILCEFNEPWLVQAGTTGEAVYRSLLAYGLVDRGGNGVPIGGAVANRFLTLADHSD
jgi:FkbM family methyltransferase